MFPPVPFKRIFEEHYVLYKKQKLYFDFFVRECSLLVECQGQQHFNYVKHFHGDRAGFLGQKKRDNLKIEYIQENDLYLIYINYNEEVTKELIYNKINRAMDSKDNFCG
jgi:hypothetical protein